MMLTSSADSTDGNESASASLKMSCWFASKSAADEKSPVRATLDFALIMTPTKSGVGTDVGEFVGTTVGSPLGREVGSDEVG